MKLGALLWPFVSSDVLYVCLIASVSDRLNVTACSVWNQKDCYGNVTNLIINVLCLLYSEFCEEGIECIIIPPSALVLVRYQEALKASL